MKAGTLLYLILQGIFVAIILDQVFGLTLNDVAWWVGCIVFNGVGVFLHRAITREDRS